MISQLKVHFQPIAALVIRGGSVLAGFFVTLYIGRTLGPEANGTYGLITQSAMFLSVVAVGGLDLATVRQLAGAVVEKKRLDRTNYLAIVGYTMGIAVLISAALLIGGKHASELLTKADLPFKIVLILIFIFISRTLTRVMSAILRSQGSYIIGQAVEVFFIPTSVCIALVVGSFAEVTDILTFTATSGMIVGISAVLFGLRFTQSDGQGFKATFRSLMKIALPLWSVSIALNISDWYSLVTVAGTLGVYDAGLYRVAYQISSALAVITLGLYSVFSPKVSAARAAGDDLRVALLGRSATRLSIAFAAPAVIILFVFAPQILGLVGEEFVAASPILRIMTVAQAIYVAAGPSGLVLAMCGQERYNFLITATSLGLLIVCAPLAAQWFGLVGVSVFVGAAMVGRNVASYFALRRLTGINILNGTVEGGQPQRA
ncbi:oligosaccharide flippase family protein [Novosphingobium sp. YJ-S2-02]|uniref:Oligosaccharide flippase family protein n=1 Tax=Novosphingobium aureum TaxID=2792964 RepID=A0A931MJV1_9SPHN|nr:oligosaccharide flippase family protein [Novosphingobium aureum]MBH0111341.1 oligosaccharide flippase family protein [Novosphingobium aureum]